MVYNCGKNTHHTLWNVETEKHIKNEYFLIYVSSKCEVSATFLWLKHFQKIYERIVRARARCRDWISASVKHKNVGRYIKCSTGHIWTYFTQKGENWKIFQDFPRISIHLYMSMKRPGITPFVTKSYRIRFAGVRYMNFSFYYYFFYFWLYM